MIFQFPAHAASITPNFWSMGPIHHGQQNLEGVECLKQLCVRNFLSETNKPLGHLMREMRQVMTELRAHYVFLEGKWGNDMEFVKLMIWDGCTMLIFLRAHGGVPLFRYPHFGTHRSFSQLRDMVLLSNQLPLLAVKVLIQIMAASSDMPPPVSN
ncbi:hypothetical protein DsansV1_C08g0083251 [Dioscorea sansibarensis]